MNGHRENAIKICFFEDILEFNKAAKRKKKPFRYEDGFTEHSYSRATQYSHSSSSSYLNICQVKLIKKIKEVSRKKICNYKTLI